MVKVDKIFIWASVAPLFVLLISILCFCIPIFGYKQINSLVPVSILTIIIEAFLVPICNLILIATFFIKIRQENKIKNDMIKIIINLFCIIFYSIISYYCIAFLFAIFLSDGIKS